MEPAIYGWAAALVMTAMCGVRARSLMALRAGIYNGRRAVAHRH